MPHPTDDHHESMVRGFRWKVPQHFNIADVCCARWAEETPDAVALYSEHADGTTAHITYGELQAQANRLSHALQRRGVEPGDRVAIVLPQRVETAIAHMAVYQLGAVAMPLSMLFGPDALAFRLQDSEAGLAIVDDGAADNLALARLHCPMLQTVIGVGAAQGRCDADWDTLVAREPGQFTARITQADDAAILIYTSGTTGPPKGAVLPHRALIGNLSGFVCSQNWFPQRGDVFWSPADWAWTGGLMDALLPTLYFGHPIVGYRGRFTPEKAFDLMTRYGVTNTFLFPTALKAMMKAVPTPRRHHALKLRAIMSAGESVGEAVFDYCRSQLGITLNEMFGQTEINYVIGNCGQFLDHAGSPAGGWPARRGSMGRAYPGHRVAVIDEAGEICPTGTPGDVAVHRRDLHGDLDPIFFLGYWRNPEATQGKFTGDPRDSWCRTGDTAIVDDDGYFWYRGRSDDMFKAAGYRIGPNEIENCLIQHPSVVNAAVVPKPDAERGATVKAFVVLTAGMAGSGDLVRALQAHVRGKLAPYEYPKEIEFVDELPMTTTGKVQRRVLRLREEEKARSAL